VQCPWQCSPLRVLAGAAGHTWRSTIRLLLQCWAAQSGALLGSAVLGSAVLGCALLNSAVLGCALLNSAVQGSELLGSSAQRSAGQRSAVLGSAEQCWADWLLRCCPVGSALPAGSHHAGSLAPPGVGRRG
jgi:hypothetical protein